MFSSIKRLIGSISIEHFAGKIKVDGVPADVIANDIRKIWKTSRIENNLFVRIDKNSFIFYEFFAVEIVYAIDRILSSPRMRTSRRTLTNIREKLMQETWLSRRNVPHANILDRSMLQNFVFQPTPDQKELFDRFERLVYDNRLTGFLVAGAAGSGKTYMGLALADMLHADVVLVCAPSNALYEVWEDTIKTKMLSPGKVWISKDNKPMEGDEKYIVFHYEYLKNVLASLDKFKRGRVVLLLDESHNFNEVKSIRSDLLVQLSKHALFTVWMSGTPIKALTSEAIPFIRCIDPLFTPEVEEAFKGIFGVSSQRANDMLNNRLNGMAHFIPKSALGLPDPIIETLSIKIPNGSYYTLDAIRARMKSYYEQQMAFYEKNMKEYEDYFYGVLKQHESTLRTFEQKKDYEKYRLCLPLVIQYRGDAMFVKDEMVYCNRYEKSVIMPQLSPQDKSRFKSTKTIVKYVNLKVMGECLGRIVGRARVEAHVELAKHFNYIQAIEAGVKKTVVFTAYVEVLEATRAVMKELGLKSEYVYGATNKNIDAILERFKADEDINPLFATYASLSTAIPLLSANVLVMIDAPYRDHSLQQTISRIHRRGQDEQCYVFMTTMDTGGQPNITTRTIDILSWSQQQVASITGLKSPYELSAEETEPNASMESLSLSLEGLDAGTSEPAFHGW